MLNSLGIFTPVNRRFVTLIKEKLMNKKLLAVAIASAVAAPMAVLADEGNVTISGHANMAVEVTDNGNDSTTNVATNGSDLAISGWEGLGNGLKAVFLMKSHIGLDDGSLFNAGGKDGYAGLAGAFGTVALGFHGQPYKTSTGGLDIFNDTIADHSSVMNGGGVYDSGIGNAIIWFLPNMNGFSGHLQYGADETGNDNNPWGAQFNYSNGPWYVTYAHADDGVDGTADKIGGSFTFGGATTLAVIYETLDGNSSSPASAHLDHDAFYLALSHNMGNNTFKLAYANADDDTASSTGADYWAVGVDHHFSKRTLVYGLYTRVNNDSNGTYGLGTTGSSNATGAVAPGEDPSSFAFGIKHSF